MNTFDEAAHPDLRAINALGMHRDLGGCDECRIAVPTRERWIVARTRPGDNAASLSISVHAGSTNVALIRFLEKYGQQVEGTRVTIRRPGTRWTDWEASYVKGEHVWEQLKGGEQS